MPASAGEQSLLAGGGSLRSHPSWRDCSAAGVMAYAAAGVMAYAAAGVMAYAAAGVMAYAAAS